jgi:hypothetical protein
MAIDKEEGFILLYNGRICIDHQCDLQVTNHARVLKQHIKDKLGFDYGITKGNQDKGNIFLSLKAELKSEEYQLFITENRITIYGGSNAGILYGVQTLRQLIDMKGAVLPCITIEDYPDMPNRGFYHDATRGRIPTLNTLKALADKLAYYKINQLQLYIEHSFLFQDFSEVWRDDTPLTPEDILEFDQYCQSLHIDLVPSLASFGHLYKILQTKTYAHLCEIEDSDQEPFSFFERMAHHTLDISNEESYQFVTKMLSEYLPLFSSNYFNLCADETFDLGKGRSKELANRFGVNNMYIDFVNKICEFIISKGKQPMFWGDIICGMPEAIKRLPKETICLNWGYAAEQSERETKLLYEAGAVQYVCPGVGGWNQLVNLLRSSYENITRMCSYGRTYHAIGVLNTDWGDYGHVNHPEFSTAGMIYGAAFSWSDQLMDFEEINKQISRLEYGDRTETFLAIYDELSRANAVTWFEVVCFKELGEKSLARKPWGPVFENITWEKAYNANKTIDNCIASMYRIISDAPLDKREIYRAYLTAAEGMKLWNEIGALTAVGEREGLEGKQALALAVKLEYWYQEYKQLWRSVSKESELFRIGEVVFWYADFLREKTKSRDVIKSVVKKVLCNQ